MNVNLHYKHLKSRNYLVAKKLIDKTNNEEDVQSSQVVEADLVQYKLVENQYQQRV